MADQTKSLSSEKLVIECFMSVFKYLFISLIGVAAGLLLRSIADNLPRFLAWGLNICKKFAHPRDKGGQERITLNYTSTNIGAPFLQMPNICLALLVALVAK